MKLERPPIDIYYRVPPSYPIIEYSNDISPLPGNIVIQTTERIPDGYLLCDGSDVSREVESSLFNAIGTFYGNGDGSTTFCLPDLEDEEQLNHYMIKR
jgi:microcystin-dependent protein